MHDLQAAARQCMETLAGLGIHCGPIGEVAVDTRARRTWGTCRKLPDGSFRIGISPKLLEDGVPLESLKETLYHELLHAAAHGDGHNGRWKALAAYVNRSLGTNIRRTASWADHGLDMDRDATIRYRFVCTGCGQEIVRFRACAFTKHTGSYRCARCGGKFKPK